MRRSLLGGLVLSSLAAVAVSPAVARAGDLPRDQVQALEAACPALGAVTRAATIGARPRDQVLQVWPAGGPRAIVVFDADGCAVLPVGRASGRATGRFVPGPAAQKAFALVADGCASDACPAVIVVRRKDSETALLDALPFADGCVAGIELTALKAFPAIDSLGVLCKGGGGPGYVASGTVLHGGAGALRPIHTWAPGARQDASPDELDAGTCHIGHVGRLTVAKRGAAPTLRIVAAADGLDDAGWPAAGTDRRGACAAQRAVEQDWIWDPTAAAFAARGPARRILRAVCDCPRRRRR